METDGDSPPFWSQPSSTILHHRRRRSPALTLTPVSLILLFPILILLFIFFLVPPFLSQAAHFLRPTYSIKKRWDSVSFLLVALAILCGIFAKRKEDVSDAQNANEQNDGVSSSSYTNRPAAEPVLSGGCWYSDTIPVEPERGLNRLRRNASSYPELRQAPLGETEETRFRFYDDSEVNLYRKPAGESPVHGGTRWSEAEREYSDIKVIPVDTFEVRSPQDYSHTPSPAPRPGDHIRQRRTLHGVPRREKIEKPIVEPRSNESRSPPPPPPPPPPAPPPPLVEVQEFTERTPQKLQRKKSGKTKEITTAIASLYNPQKRKKKMKNMKIEDSSSKSSPPSIHSTPPPPSPPPPSKVFHNPFKKTSKAKRVHSVSSTAIPLPPPPPNSIFNSLLKTGSRSKRFSSISSSSSAPQPPPPNSIFNNLFNTGSKNKRSSKISSSGSPPPPPPSSIINTLFKHGSKSRRFKSESSTPPQAPPPPPLPSQQVSSNWKSSYSQSRSWILPPESAFRPNSSCDYAFPAMASMFYDEIVNGGSQSPLISIPPPPPLPPFRVPEFKFVARGDYVRIRSSHSSRCSSPGLDDVDEVPVKASGSIHGSGSIGPSVLCPSPDVNVKADTFIARLKDEWRLEKLHSLR